MCISNSHIHTHYSTKLFYQTFYVCHLFSVDCQKHFRIVCFGSKRIRENLIAFALKCWEIDLISYIGQIIIVRCIYTAINDSFNRFLCLNIYMCFVFNISCFDWIGLIECLSNSASDLKRELFPFRNAITIFIINSIRFHFFSPLIHLKCIRHEMNMFDIKCKVYALSKNKNRNLKKRGKGIFGWN